MPKTIYDETKILEILIVFGKKTRVDSTIEKQCQNGLPNWFCRKKCASIIHFKSIFSLKTLNLVNCFCLICNRI